MYLTMAYKIITGVCDRTYKSNYEVILCSATYLGTYILTTHEGTSVKLPDYIADAIGFFLESSSYTLFNSSYNCSMTLKYSSVMLAYIDNADIFKKGRDNEQSCICHN